MAKHSIRRSCIYFLLAVVPLGFLFKFYSGPGCRWFNDFGAGLFYEIFWILVVFLIVPKKKLVNKIPIWVFVITCALEVLQLWHPKSLETIRSFFIGAALIGTTFSWWDFPHYAIGCYLGWLWIKWLNDREKIGDLFG